VSMAICVAMSACATPPALPSTPHFQDELFKAPAVPVDASSVFELNDAMRHYVHTTISRQLRTEGMARGLVDALNERGQLKLDYDSAMTRNAEQAFEAHKGNCLSLVIMTAAFAKELGLHVTYQSVAVEDIWSRSDDMAFLSGHVNLVLGVPAPNFRPGYDPDRLLTIDFVAPKYTMNQRTTVISEDTVIAMYMNNRSAEALAHGQVDEAYWWARAAVLRSPAFSAGFNTLGVVYLRHGDLLAAEAVLGQLLEREPENTRAMANLSSVMARLGRNDEANALRARLAKVEPYPPYYFFRRGMEALQRTDFAAAKLLFEKEVARADYSGEFHFWLGIANLRLGDLKEARAELAIAMQNSTTGTEHDLYAAKLDYLRSVHSQ
jgi:Flp pilus assembly protein TadD